MKGIEKKSNENIKKNWFIICCLVWVAYFGYGIYAYFAGYSSGFFGGPMIYGYKAFRDAMIWNLIGFSIIPILPATLIYIVIYLLNNKKEKKK